MGYPAEKPYEWMVTDTLQLLNHGVSPAADALQCSACQENKEHMDLPGEIGYGLKDAREIVCSHCQGGKERNSFISLRNKHVKDMQYDCCWCHGYSRPESGLRMP